jgi:hypothetical protein
MGNEVWSVESVDSVDWIDLAQDTNQRWNIMKTGFMLYMLFWVFPRRQIVLCRRFGTLCGILNIQSLKMDITESSETSEKHNLTPEKYPKEHIQYSEHDKSLKSRTYFMVCWRCILIIFVMETNLMHYSSLIYVSTQPLHASGKCCPSTALQAGRSRVRFQMLSLEFFIVIILPPALLPRGFMKQTLSEHKYWWNGWSFGEGLESFDPQTLCRGPCIQNRLLSLSIRTPK